MPNKIEVTDLIDIEAAKAAFKDLSKEINSTSTSLTAASKSMKDVTEAIKDGNKAVEDYKSASTAAKKKTAELTEEQIKQKIVAKESAQIAKTQAEAQLYAADSIKGMQAQIKILNAEYVKMDKNARDNTLRGKELGATLKGLRDNLNEVKQAAGDSTSNIGKYSEGFKKGLAGIGQVANQATGAIGGVGKAFIQALTSPIGIIIAAVAGIVSFANKFNFVKDVFAGVSASLSALGKNVDKIFDAWINWLKILWNAIKGVALLLVGDFSGAWDSFKEVGKNAGEMVDNIKKVGDALVDAYTAGADLSRITREMFAANNELTQSIDEIADGFGYLTVVMNDTTRSMAERHAAFLQLERDTKRVFELEVKRAENNLKVAKAEMDLAAATSANGKKSQEYLEKELIYLEKKKASMDATSKLGDYAAGANQRAMKESVKMATESINSVERLNTAITKGIEKSANDSTTTLLELGVIGEQVARRTAKTAEELGKAIEMGTRGKLKSTELFDKQGILKADEDIEASLRRANLAEEERAMVTQVILLLNKNNALAMQVNNRLLADTKKLTEDIAAADKVLLDQTIRRSEALAAKGGVNDLEALQSNNAKALELEKKGYEEQKAALLKARQERINIIAATGGGESAELLKERKQGDAALEALEVQHQDNLRKIAETEKTWRAALIKNITEEQARLIEQAEGEILKDELEKKTTLENRYRAGLITQEQFAKESVRIENESARAKMEIQIKYLERLASASNIGEDERAKVLNQITAIRLELQKLDSMEFANLAEQFKKLSAAVEQTAAYIAQSQMAMFEISKNQSQQRIQDLQEEMQALEYRANVEMQRYQGNAVAQKAIQDKLAADKAALQKKENAEKRKQAELDKAQALFNIALNTAVAVTKVMASPYLIAATIAVGALQAAAVASRPIPAYEKGTEFAEGGVSLIGERGAELVQTRRGDIFLSPATPTLMDIPRGSKVLNAKETKKALERGSVTINVEPQKAETLISIDREGIKGIVKESYITTKRYY